MDGKAVRPISKLFGKSYAPGDPIPAEVISKITPQVLRTLVNKGDIEVAGMIADAGGGGVAQHLQARADRADDRIKKLEAANTALEARLAALEAKDGGTAIVTRRSRRKAGEAK